MHPQHPLVRKILVVRPPRFLKFARGVKWHNNFGNRKKTDLYLGELSDLLTSPIIFDAASFQ